MRGTLSNIFTKAGSFAAGTGAFCAGYYYSTEAFSALALNFARAHPFLALAVCLAASGTAATIAARTAGAAARAVSRPRYQRVEREFTGPNKCIAFTPAISG